MQARARTRLGPYVLRAKIGEGGNATVWRASGPDGEVAVKVLKATRPGEPLDRFRREVAEQLALADVPGVLPLLDAEIPSDGDGLAWLAMPLATRVDKALGDAPPVDVIVDLLATVAEVLATLHKRGLAHRDIKPANLYRTADGAWAVGDFGLVDVPDAEPLTTGLKGLGPRNFIAPEMLMHPDRAEGPPADVYSLAKTAWVLLTRQRVPPPGEHRLDVPALQLGGYVDHPRARELDVLIAAMTRHEPSRRPSMDRVAGELRAWLAAPAVGSVTGDLSAVVAVANSLSEVMRSEKATRAASRLALDDAMAMYRGTVAEGVLGPLRESGLPFFSQPYSDNTDGFETDGSMYLNVAVPLPDGRSVTERRSLGALVRTEDELPGLVLWIGLILEDGGVDALCLAGATIVRWGGSAEPLWFESETAVLGGPGMPSALARLATALAQRAPEDAASWIAALRS